MKAGSDVGSWCVEGAGKFAADVKAEKAWRLKASCEG